MATFERAMMRNLGPMSVTGSNHNASQEITMITAAGMADLEKSSKLLTCMGCLQNNKGRNKDPK